MGSNANEKKVKLKNTNQTDVTKKKLKMDLPEADQKKKIWSYDALKEAMQPSMEELEYREEKVQESDFVQKYSKLFKCTRCQISIKPIIVKHMKVPTHPCLGVLMCQKCCDYYEDGEFSLDSDGEDKYCRWCGDGGTIFTCSKCICGFCKSCIKQHFESKYFKQVQKDENWLCFFCNPKPLWDHRFICSLAVKMSENESNSTSFKNNEEENVTTAENNNTEKDKGDTLEEEETKTQSRGYKRRKQLKTKKKSNVESPNELKIINSKTTGAAAFSTQTSSSDESDSENQMKKVKFTSTSLPKTGEKTEADISETRKSYILSELKKIITLTQHQMDFGVTWSNKMINKYSTSDCITSSAGLAKECQKVKHFLSLMSTFLVQFSNSVDSIEKTLNRKDGTKVSQVSVKKDYSAYSNILKFLGFIRGQVKTFMEKGISLPDIFEAEVYDDDKVIGIKKKSFALNSTSNVEKSKIQNCDSNIIHKSDGESKELDKIGDNDILELVGEQTVERRDFDTEDENEIKDMESSNTSLDELNYMNGGLDSKDDIREILAILENA